MKIAILGGTGKEGQGLALRWAKGGAEVLIGSRERGKAERIASELTERLGPSSARAFRGFDNREAAANAEIVVSTLPHQGHREILEGLRKELEGKILMVATVVWPPGSTDRPSAAEEAQTVLGDDARVVAAFQTVSALALQALDQEMHEDVLVCGDDRAACQEAIDCMRRGGLRGIKSGALKHARIVEAITALMLQINKSYGVKSAGIHITGLD
ncbi:MAG: NADPH-dependent F420 reductase [Vicinamibacteria bacterium]